MVNAVLAAAGLRSRQPANLACGAAAPRVVVVLVAMVVPQPSCGGAIRRVPLHAMTEPHAATVDRSVQTPSPPLSVK